MKKVVFSLAVLLATVSFAWAGSWLEEYQSEESSGIGSSGLLRPYQHNAYGLGQHSDATGRPFKWFTEDEEEVAPFVNVKPNGYGLGVGMDQYGRPVKGVPSW